MSCNKPLKGFVIPAPWSEKGYEIKVQGQDVKCMMKVDGRWMPSTDEKIPIGSREVVYDSIPIPCGRCYGCRLDYSKQWADRCIMELEEHESAYFLTLTYDDAHLPWPPLLIDMCEGKVTEYTWLDEDTGEWGSAPTLRKRDVQLFHKRLRKMTGQKIRYFVAGEYGDHTHRPHYHAIEFGLKIDDLVPYKYENGYWLYRSKTIDDIWQNGAVIIGKCTWETCAYTARYVMKKVNGFERSYFDERNIEPEFVLMSRRPGLGRTFYEKHGKELYKFRSVPLSTENGSCMVRASNRYFDRLMDVDDPDFLADQKKKRVDALKHAQFLRDAQTSLRELDQLLVKEELLATKTKLLPRIDN